MIRILLRNAPVTSDEVLSAYRKSRIPPKFKVTNSMLGNIAINTDSISVNNNSKLPTPVNDVSSLPQTAVVSSINHTGSVADKHLLTIVGSDYQPVGMGGVEKDQSPLVESVTSNYHQKSQSSYSAMSTHDKLVSSVITSDGSVLEVDGYRRGSMSSSGSSLHSIGSNVQPSPHHYPQKTPLIKVEEVGDGRSGIGTVSRKGSQQELKVSLSHGDSQKSVSTASLDMWADIDLWGDPPVGVSGLGGSAPNNTATPSRSGVSAINNMRVVSSAGMNMNLSNPSTSSSKTNLSNANTEFGVHDLLGRLVLATYYIMDTH